MALNAKFSLTPREPRKYIVDSATSHVKYYAYLVHYGVFIGQVDHSLVTHYNDNKVFLYCNRVGYPFPDPFPADHYNHAVARLYFYTDEPMGKQYLLLFHVNSYGKIGVYLNGNFVREEDCNGDETIAVLVDCPGPEIWDALYVAPSIWAWIKGVDCYVI